MIKKTSFRGGGDKAAPPQWVPPYDPATDPGYQHAQEVLKGLQPGLDKASHRMTQAEIMASIPALQQTLLKQQQVNPVAAPGANWGAINNMRAPQAQQSIRPVFAPQYKGGMYNGPNTTNPNALKTPAEKFTYLAGLLGMPGGGQ